MKKAPVFVWVSKVTKCFCVNLIPAECRLLVSDCWPWCTEMTEEQTKNQLTSVLKRPVHLKKIQNRFTCENNIVLFQTVYSKSVVLFVCGHEAHLTLSMFIFHIRNKVLSSVNGSKCSDIIRHSVCLAFMESYLSHECIQI